MEIQKRLPTISEFQELRESTGWDMLSDRAVEKALPNSLFSVCAVVEGRTIGMGRVIGDGAIYFYIQDVIVLPEFQKKGIGYKIMRELEKWLKENAPENSFIGLMAAEGVRDFYLGFDYLERPTKAPGMFKLVKN